MFGTSCSEIALVLLLFLVIHQLSPTLFSYNISVAPNSLIMF